MELEKQLVECVTCSGNGYTAEHDRNDPHENGRCTFCPVQVQCEHCAGEGHLNVKTLNV